MYSKSAGHQRCTFFIFKYTNYSLYQCPVAPTNTNKRWGSVIMCVRTELDSRGSQANCRCRTEPSYLNCHNRFKFFILDLHSFSCSPGMLLCVCQDCTNDMAHTGDLQARLGPTIIGVCVCSEKRLMIIPFIYSFYAVCSDQSIKNQHPGEIITSKFGVSEPVPGGCSLEKNCGDNRGEGHRAKGLGPYWIWH